MKGLRHRLNDPPFVSYIGLGPFFIAWGNGLELDIGRLYFRKQRKAKWEKKACGCVKTRLPRAGQILIRCTKHRGRPSASERRLCYFDDAGQVRLEA